MGKLSIRLPVAILSESIVLVSGIRLAPCQRQSQAYYLESGLYARALEMSWGYSNRIWGQAGIDETWRTSNTLIIWAEPSSPARRAIAACMRLERVTNLLASISYVITERCNGCFEDIKAILSDCSLLPHCLPPHSHLKVCCTDHIPCTPTQGLSTKHPPSLTLPRGSLFSDVST